MRVLFSPIGFTSNRKKGSKGEEADQSPLLCVCSRDMKLQVRKAQSQAMEKGSVWHTALALEVKYGHAGMDIGDGLKMKSCEAKWNVDCCLGTAQIGGCLFWTHLAAFSLIRIVLHDRLQKMKSLLSFFLTRTISCYFLLSNEAGMVNMWLLMHLPPPLPPRRDLLISCFKL